ncbi:MAG: ArsB/NhaD family transporter [Gammaproteobacteria bacterium]|jgi:Na+/H+ antiporter NhaD/arsenite permease-like protein|nr:ArsB/NhaD family transporter [Gammaproteobacteria bacterium]MDP7456061.1 ArsB/NhaD family transporter [Gammaproteobacteria bacterium]
METLEWTNQMLVSAVVLAVTFVGIFSEGIHGIHRVKVAMAGAAVMIVVGQVFSFYGPEDAVEAIDWNVVFLLGGMMTIVAIMIPTGGFQQLAYAIADYSKGRLFLLMALMGTLVTGLSLLLDNVTTVVIFGPLIILICQSLRVSAIPFLLAAALLSDTGGVATLVGDPPNLMIGSAAGIDFNTFVIHMGGMVLVAWLIILIFLRYLFKEELSVTPHELDLTDREPLSDPKTWYGALGVLGIMVIGFIMHNALDWEPWFVTALGLTALAFIGNDIDMEEAFAHTELALLMFFISLFIIVGGVEHSQFLEYLGTFIVPYVEQDLLMATIMLMWVSAVLSAAIDNIPFTAAMIPIILGMDAQGINVAPLWWGLAAGVGMGGNGTHLGSTANVFIVTISEKMAKDQGDPSLAITPGLWFRKGLPVMLLTLVTCTIIMYLFFDFFAEPLV